MKGKIVAFLKDESGQTSTEYILLVAIVAMIVMKFGGELRTRLEALIGKVFGRVDTEFDRF